MPITSPESTLNPRIPFELRPVGLTSVSLNLTALPRLEPIIISSLPSVTNTANNSSFSFNEIAILPL